MAHSYYIDESGSTGDAVHVGPNFTFGGQPVFTMACVGIDDLGQLESYISTLRRKHKVQGKELKSKAKSARSPGFVQGIVQYLRDRNAPVFVEVVDKKYFISANIVNSLVMPACYSPPETDVSRTIRQHSADFIYGCAPESLYDLFLLACRSPSHDSLMRVFGQMHSFAATFTASNPLSEFLKNNVKDSIDGYQKMMGEESKAYLQFLPVPDFGKGGGQISMLPHISSFATIYARINRLHQGDMDGVRLFHDEQNEFGEVIRG